MIESHLREGREIKRKRKPPPPGGKDGKKQKVNLGGNQTAMEAIEKMVQGSAVLDPEMVLSNPAGAHCILT